MVNKYKPRPPSGRAGKRARAERLARGSARGPRAVRTGPHRLPAGPPGCGHRPLGTARRAISYANQVITDSSTHRHMPGALATGGLATGSTSAGRARSVSGGGTADVCPCCGRRVCAPQRGRWGRGRERGGACVAGSLRAPPQTLVSASPRAPLMGATVITAATSSAESDPGGTGPRGPGAGAGRRARAPREPPSSSSLSPILPPLINPLFLRRQIVRRQHLNLGDAESSRFIRNKRTAVKRTPPAGRRSC